VGRHAADPVTAEKVPKPHRVATDIPDTPHAAPASHGWQLVAPCAGPYVVMLHSGANESPSCTQNVPYGHSVHTDFAVAGL